MEKKILVTGMTSGHCKGTNALKYTPSPTILCNYLEELGHEVVRRPVHCGEDLDQFDRVILYLAPTNALGSRYIFGALWTQYTRPDRILALNDWQVRAIVNSLRNAAKKPEQYLWHTNKKPQFVEKLAPTRLGWDESLIHKDCIIKAVQELGSFRSLGPMIAPLFKWGKPEMILFPGADIVPWDPSPGPLQEYMGSKPKRRADKRREWICATLGNHGKWVAQVNPKWPVVWYGPRKYEAPRLKEPQLMEQYAETWGILSPKYYHAGSGWYRTRVFQAAGNGCVLYQSISEAGKMGQCFKTSIRYIEAMTDAELRNLSTDQFLWLHENCSTKEESMQQLQGILDLVPNDGY